MRYVVAIEKGDKKHAYGVVVSDLPGCFSAGDTLDEALSNAKEAILLHLEGLMDEKKPAPAPKPLETHQKNRKYKGWTLPSSMTRPSASTSRCPAKCCA
jgi:predicted RNase H-like HicB family nuclease